MPHATAWRHLKLRGGYLLDYGVHAADLLLYFMGEVDRVYAETHLWEQVRYVGEPQSESMKRFYSHRVKEEIERRGSVECTSEDMVVAVVRFKSGAIGQFTQTVAAPGERTGAGIVYCDDGSINLPGSRSGRALRVTRIGKDAYLSEDATLDLVPGFRLDDTTAPLFDGQRRISSYDIPFADIDRKLIALELEDFAGAIRDSREPEVTGQVGLDAVALTYAFLESGALHQAVTVADVAEDRVNAYQQEINEAAGL
jgi:predicted dehydrogenase